MVKSIFSARGAGEADIVSQGILPRIIEHMAAACKIALSPGADGPSVKLDVVLGKLAEGLSLLPLVTRAEQRGLIFDHIIPAVELCFIAPCSGFSAVDAMCVYHNVGMRLPLDERKWVLNTPFSNALELARTTTLSDAEETGIARWQGDLSGGNVENFPVPKA